MKLIIAGSTGFVATEIIKQALSNPDVTSIIALARREISVPQILDDNADITKIKAVTCDDFSNYSESARRELEGTDACIWLIAITPSKMKDSALDEARKSVFIYVSGHKSERDQSRQSWVMGHYLLMRGEAESRVIEFAQVSNGMVEVCIAKPGLIDGPDHRQGWVGSVLSTIGRSLIGLPKVDVGQIAATLLEQAVKGIEKETLSNEDLVRIGDKVLSG
ncbi:uncharacterized protein EAF01_005147 [Botrytis porri]|uniref:NAD(P)-binding domain-containing protein n=1 Tax=Botrytis porri TaxID=87229 RepID=A0A4Z1KZC6_9HELO|nr:uncharacterized protein EAF01_005147 [Botrytis porri]KAF7907561.1 hypothetical protein EAF01_005147 [Botrytis porri]TGO89878.1 hypothetical protein BPOR_0089g00080 [Botrytis porri]